MTRTQIYLPDEMHHLVKTACQKENISMAALIRNCIGAQYSDAHRKKSAKIVNATAKGLLNLSGLVKKGPRDMGKNHDHYLYGNPKK